MTFLQPLLLWGLPLCLIPIIIHLMNRIRYRSVHWAAIMFLIKANRSSTSMARLRQFLILMFRVLAVLVLIFALARPLAGGWLGWTFSGPPETVIIILDRSASMGSEYSNRISRLKQARKILVDAAKGFTGTRFVLIENVNRRPSDIASPDMLANLADTAQTQSAADIPALVDDAVNHIIANKTGVTEIWIASDMQLGDWQPENSKWREVESKIKSMSQPVKLRILALDSKSDENLSVRLVKINPPRLNDPQSAEMIFEINRTGSSEAVIPVTIVKGENKKQINIKLGAASNKLRQKISSGANSSDNSGYIEIPADCNPCDNRAYFSFPVQNERKTVIVIQDKNISSEILSIASCPDEKKQSNVKYQQPVSADLIDFKDTSLIIWMASFPSEETQKILRQFIAEGGAVIFFPPENDDPAKLFSSITWEKCEVRKEGGQLSVKDWEKRSGPFEDTASGENLPLSELRISKTRQLSGSGLNPIATFGDGKILLARMKIMGGAAYFCTTLPASDWSNLGDGQVLVPMLQRMLSDGGARLSKTVFSDCGNSGLETGNMEIRDLDATEQKNPRINSGVYKCGDRILVFNRPSSEDVQEYIGTAELDDILKGISFSTLHEKSGNDSSISTEIWKAFLILMLLFLVAEAFLCMPPLPRSKNKKAVI